MPRNLPLHENAPPLIMLDNRAAVRSDERLEIFAMTETIKLTNGTELPLDNHWRTIATQEASSMVDGGRYVHPSISNCMGSMPLIEIPVHRRREWPAVLHQPNHRRVGDFDTPVSERPFRNVVPAHQLVQRPCCRHVERRQRLRGGRRWSLNSGRHFLLCLGSLYLADHL